MVLSDRIAKLSKTLRLVSDEQGANAAVALLVKLRDEKLHVLFVRRVQNPADPWSGQVGLPGGKRDATDGDLKQTAIRETLEETGINLLSHCRFLGVLTALHSTPRPEIKILPFIIFLEEEQPIRLNEKELEEYCWVSIEKLVESRANVKFSFGELPAYIVGKTIIWGLTYRIIESLIPHLIAAKLLKV